MTVQLQKVTQYHYLRAVMTIFPLAPAQTIAQMWSNGVWGGDEQERRSGCTNSNRNAVPVRSGSFTPLPLFRELITNMLDNLDNLASRDVIGHVTFDSP